MISAKHWLPAPALFRDKHSLRCGVLVHLMPSAGLIDAPLPPPPPEFPADTVWLVYITAQLCTGARLRSREATDAITAR
jgi:hypothetical protein